MSILDNRNRLNFDDINFLINQFNKRCNEINHSSLITLPLETQNFITNNPIKAYTPQDLYPIHCHVVKLSASVRVCKDSKLIDTWKKILCLLDGKKYPIRKDETSETFEDKRFDCTPVLQIFAEGPFTEPPIIYRVKAENIPKILDTIIALDQEGYGTNHSKNYYDTLLQAPETLCLIAVLQKKIIAYAWGSISTTTKNLQLHSLTRKANFPGFNLAQRFFQAIKEIKLKEIKLFETISFDVCTENSGAQRICHELFSIDIMTLPQPKALIEVAVKADLPIRAPLPQRREGAHALVTSPLEKLTENSLGEVIKAKKISLIHFILEGTTKMISCQSEKKFLTRSLSEIDGENFYREEAEENKQVQSLPTSKETTPIFLTKTYNFFKSFSLTGLLKLKTTNNPVTTHDSSH